MRSVCTLPLATAAPVVGCAEQKNKNIGSYAKHIRRAINWPTQEHVIVAIIINANEQQATLNVRCTFDCIQSFSFPQCDWTSSINEGCTSVSCAAAVLATLWWAGSSVWDCPGDSECDETRRFVVQFLEVSLGTCVLWPPIGLRRSRSSRFARSLAAILFA